MTPLHPADLLREVLKRLWLERDSSFSGAGLILYDHIEIIPASPLRIVQPPDLPVGGVDPIVSAMLRLCRIDNMYHDGFHLISSDGYLTKVAMYFSPPIIFRLRDLELDEMHGGRYRAALYGSCIAGVLACGVVSNTYGPVVFEQGVPFSLSDTSVSRSI